MPTRGDVARTFDRIAASWDVTRATPWPIVSEFLATCPPGSDVIDVGCGNGVASAELRRRGCRVVGVDASRALLRIARSKTDAALAAADVCALPLPDERFDALLAVATLHHLPSDDERLVAARELHRVLRPGGRGFLTVWARDQPRFESPGTWRPAPDGGSGDIEVGWNLGDETAWRFYHLFQGTELRDLAVRAGFSVETYFRAANNYVAGVRRHG